eukprot:647340_1
MKRVAYHFININIIKTNTRLATMQPHGGYMTVHIANIFNINRSMALPMMTAVQAFCKRVLQPMYFDWSAGNIMHDNLNSFAEYTLACYGFVHELTQNTTQAMPFQLD